MQAFFLTAFSAINTAATSCNGLSCNSLRVEGLMGIVTSSAIMNFGSGLSLSALCNYEVMNLTVQIVTTGL